MIKQRKKGNKKDMATNIQTLIEEFKQGKHNELLKDIYVDEAVIEYQQERYIKA